jgi:hypothetical protein
MGPRVDRPASLRPRRVCLDNGQGRRGDGDEANGTQVVETGGKPTLAVRENPPHGEETLVAVVSGRGLNQQERRVLPPGLVLAGQFSPWSPLRMRALGSMPRLHSC